MELKESKKQQYERYLAEYDIEKTITEMLNSLVHEKSKQPIVFMIKYLTGLLTDQQKFDNNINVLGPYPQNIPLVKYPELDNNNSLLKNHITRRLWQHIKFNKTKNGNTIMEIIKLKDEKIGALLPDGDCLRAFNTLIEPMLKSLNPELDDEFVENIFEPIVERIMPKRVNIAFSRNIRDANFMSSIGLKQLEQNEELIRSTIEQLSNENIITTGKFYNVKENETEIRIKFSNIFDYDKHVAELERLELKKCKFLFYF
jgi:hypothetical protein